METDTRPDDIVCRRGLHEPVSDVLRSTVRLCRFSAGISSGLSSWHAAQTGAAQAQRAASCCCGFSRRGVRGGLVDSQPIHPEKLTHINFAFARIVGRQSRVPGSIGSEPGTVTALKKQNPQSKVLVSVGGWKAEGFSDAALTDARGSRLRGAPSSASRHALGWHRPGLEYPGQGVAGIKFRREDKQNFTLLLKSVATTGQQRAMRAARRRRSLCWTIAIGRSRVLRSHRDGQAARLSRLDQHHELRLLQQPDRHDRASRGPASLESAAADRSQCRRSVKQHLAAGIPPASSCSGWRSTVAVSPA